MSDFVEPLDPSTQKALYDPRTLQIGFWQRRRLFPWVLLVALALGAVCGLTLGAPSYEAETDLLYRLPGDESTKTNDTTMAATLAQAILSRAYLQEVAGDLQVKMPVDVLAKRFEVNNEKGTTLISLTARGRSPDEAVALANTLAGVFLRHDLERREQERAQAAQTLQRRVQEYQDELARREKALQDFTVAHPEADFNHVADTSLVQEDSAAGQYRQAQLELKVAEEQESRLQDLIASEQRRVNSSPTHSKIDVSVAATNLRDKISQDREYRANLAELAQVQADFDRAGRLKSKGLISNAEYERAAAQFQKQRALTLDTNKTRAWEQQLDALKTQATVQDPHPDTSALQGLLDRSVSNQMQVVALQEKLNYLKSTHKSAKDPPHNLSQLQAQYDALTRRIEIVINDMRDPVQQLSQLDVGQNEAVPELVVLGAARGDTVTKRDRRVLVGGLGTLMGLLLGAAVLVRVEMTDATVKSRGDLRVRLPLRVLGQLPKTDRPPFPPDPETAVANYAAMLARQVRFKIPQGCARLLVTSALAGEGKTVVSANLALALARQQERVLLLDAQTRSGSTHGVRDLMSAAHQQGDGLAELLARGLSLESVVHASVIPGVQCIGRGNLLLTPELLASPRMADLMERAAQSYSVIVVDGPEAIGRVEAELLAPRANGIVVVIRAGQTPVPRIQEALDDLTPSGVPVLGGVLNAVDRAYLDA